MPKGVALTHHNMISNSRQSVRFESKGLSWDSDAQLIMLPFYHIYVGYQVGRQLPTYQLY